MTKSKNPPKMAALTAQLRWYLENCGTTPVEVARQTGIHHSALYRFLNDTRGLSHDATDRLAKYLNLRLVRDKKEAVGR